MNVVQLVKKAKKGNKQALLQLILVEKDAYYRLAFTYMGNSHDAMDMIEEMIIKLYDSIEQLKKNEMFYSWSKTILVNHCKTVLKQRKREILLEDTELVHEDEQNHSKMNDPYERIEQQIDIQQLLTYINEDQKEAIQLKYFHDLDYETIAAITNVSIGTAKSRVFQGLRKLRDHYRGDADE